MYFTKLFLLYFEELAKKIEAYNWKDTYFKLRDLGSKKNQLNSEISKKYTELENISLWKKLDINPKVLKQLKTTNGYLGIVPLKLKNQYLLPLELNSEYGIRLYASKYARVQKIGVIQGVESTFSKMVEKLSEAISPESAT